VNLPPWYKLVAPREDLRENRPLDAAEFAVHLDRVRSGDAPEVYVDPERFFERTYPTKNLKALAAEVLRRLAGETVGASAVFNLTTQFGGGKTHALTLLYHLARAGAEAGGWEGVRPILEQAGLEAPPRAAVAVFVGQKFDPVSGRTGPGEPTRRTPWGEIAFQLGGERAYQVLAAHDRHGVAPDSGTLAAILPADRSALILMDEVMNYVSRARTVPAGENRASNGAAQFYAFLQNLTEALQGRGRAVLLAALQASEMEMSAEDESDYGRLQKLLDRVAKAVLLSEGTEIAEIVRRRLFDWGGLPPPARRVAAEYAGWLREHRQLVPGWFPIDQAEDAFCASYPLHPTLLSVFERKWQTLPRFQRTRGVLRLLALWIAAAYQQGYRRTHGDPLITVGTAPWELAGFRSALFEQLGEQRLEAAVTTDIAGERGAHALRLDEAAPEPVREARLHRQVATAIFFESNGGQSRDAASVPEVRLAVGRPGLDVGSVEQALEALRESCYFLHTEGSLYRFGIRPNLNKLLADRRAAVPAHEVREAAWTEVQKVFGSRKGARGEFRVVTGPERSIDVPDQPLLTLVVLRPEQSHADEARTRAFVEQCLREHGTTGRTFKNALVFCVASDPADLEEQARKHLAWKGLQEDQVRLGLDEEQREQLAKAVRESARDLGEAVWRTYRHLLLLGKDGGLKAHDLGLVHSSAADSLPALVLADLERVGDVTADLGASQLLRFWPPALPEWPTKAVRDAIFAAPQFPRLLFPDAIRKTIAEGVAQGRIGYDLTGGAGAGLRFDEAMRPEDVDIGEDSFIVTAEEARRRLAAQAGASKPPTGAGEADGDGAKTGDGEAVGGEPGGDRVGGGDEVPTRGDRRVVALSWSGDLPHQKWNLFYRQVLMPLAGNPTLRLHVQLRTENAAGIEDSVRSALKAALRDLTGEDARLEESEARE
jgi:hypothetical protein